MGLNYYQKDEFDANTNGGLTVPGFYSLKASKDLPSVSTTVKTKQTNSVYGKIDLSWKMQFSSKPQAVTTGFQHWLNQNSHTSIHPYPVVLSFQNWSTCLTT